ncbi:MAG: hypothetical protein KJ795_05540 [Gammaproteobacteria bacterium]|nr:hypothetical protein [Gammaproteobacteria bacterium]MBU1776728.1 hypothetical protein [Gammaproteobacteria bacterium]MBU1969444.1 hypothetical protein [Gammaproteobacteria bacterium]
MAGSSIRRCYAATPAPEGSNPPCRGRTYTPDHNYNGVDSFTYKVNDGLHVPCNRAVQVRPL